MVPSRLASQQEELTTCTAPRKLATALSTTLLITSDEEQSFIEQKCGCGNPPALLPCHSAPLGPSPLMEPELGYCSYSPAVDSSAGKVRLGQRSLHPVTPPWYHPSPCSGQAMGGCSIIMLFNTPHDLHSTRTESFFQGWKTWIDLVWVDFWVCPGVHG